MEDELPLGESEQESQVGRIEINFVIDDMLSRELFERARTLKFAEGRPATRTIKSIYFDTADNTLESAGLSICLGRVGRRWVQTVRIDRKASRGPEKHASFESAAPGGRISLDAISDIAARSEVMRCVDGAPLDPVFEISIRRSVSPLLLQDGTRAELSVDVGEVSAGEWSAPYREARIKLTEGDPGSLFDLADTLIPTGKLRFSWASLSARGHLLAAQGRIEPPLKPRYSEAVDVDPDQTSEQAARDMLRECLEQIAANVVFVRELDDAEGPHQLRVGLRRARSIFSLYAPVLRSPATERLKDDARWLGREVGELRDIQVVADERVRRDADLHPDEPGLAVLAGALAARAGLRRQDLRVLLAGARVQTFLLELARFVETRGWLVPQDFGQSERLAAPVAELAEEALAKHFKRVRKRAEGLASLNADERHELRKELKKLRYAVEFFSPFYPAKRVAPFLKSLKKLQTVFGELNDAVVVRSVLSSEDPAQAAKPETARAIGWTIGANQARAEMSWLRAQALWRRLEDTRPFWKS